MDVPPAPSLGRIVIYRGRMGVAAHRAAIVTATVDTLHSDNVAAGAVPGLDSPHHVHLHVLTPSERGFFVEFNVGYGDEPGQWRWPVRVP